MESQQTYSPDEAYKASLDYFHGDDTAAHLWVNKFARRDSAGGLIERSPEDAHRRMARELIGMAQQCAGALTEEAVMGVLDTAYPSQTPLQGNEGVDIIDEHAGSFRRPVVTEVRPQVLECDVVRFQNNKEKWVAFVGLLDGYPYEIFTGLQDDEEGIVLPKNVIKGKIIKQTNPDGTHRYDFQFENRRGYKTTVEGLSEKFNPEYWNYAKLISGVLRYRMPIDHVIKLVGSLQLKSESINTWKNGVERALKKYAPGSSVETE